jgi:tRNA(Leu) C34 or U34 (ribose-2'-O)-methylase TrmL
VFGRESVGLPASYSTHMQIACGGIRPSAPCAASTSATTVSIVLYDALRRAGALDHTFVEFEPTP